MGKGNWSVGMKVDGGAKGEIYVVGSEGVRGRSGGGERGGEYLY